MHIKRTVRTLALLPVCLTASYSFAQNQQGNPFKEPAQDNAVVFVENKNQWESPVQFKANLPGGSVFLTKKGFTYSYYSVDDLLRIHDQRHDQPGNSYEKEIVHCHAFNVNFVGAHIPSSIRPEHKKSYYHNYFIGNDQSRWAGNVSVFEKVVYHDIYPGIDAAVYGKETSMKYDFIVAPGAKPSDIALQFDGATMQLLPNGNLMIKTSVNQVEEGAPYVYQVAADGKQVNVKCNYVLDQKKGIVRFSFPQGYDQSKELIIDPTLVFGTYSGGTGSTFGFSATYDNNGNLYAGGECFGAGWPTTTGSFQMTFAAGQDAGINKYSTTGTTLIYSTYYGGNGSDLPNNMMVNSNGELVLCGSTSSTNLATTTGCYSATLAGATDIYVAHFNAGGTGLIGATYVGGSGADAANTSTLSPNYGDANRGEVFTDATGNIYVASSTSSTNFPVTATAVQTTLGGAQDGCVIKLNSTCSALLYSTYLGGSGNDACFALLLNSAGNIVTVGGTASTNFPTSSNALHSTSQGGTDGFVTILNTTTGLVNSTYLGTSSYDHAFKVQIDPSDNVLVMGQTSGNYPISSGVYSYATGDIFIDKLSPNLSTSLLATRLGNVQTGTKFVPTAFLLDECGNTYLCGFYPNTTLPVSANAFATSGGFWLCVLNPDFASLMYATFIGGGNHVDGGTSRFDPKGIVYHSVCTADLNFPTNPTVWSPTKLASGFDCASFKFNFEATGVHANFTLATNSSDSGCAPHTVSFVNESLVASGYEWDFGDNTATSTAVSPTHTFTAPGIYTVTLHASNPLSCITDDTFRTKIYVFSTDAPVLTTNDTVICLFQPIDISVQVANPASTVTYAWTPANAINGNPNQQTVNVNTQTSQDYTVTVTNTNALCSASSTADVHIDVFDPILFNFISNDTLICKGQSVPLRVQGSPLFNYQWTPDIDIDNADTMSTFATPDVSRMYRLTVTYSNCLPHTDSVMVNVEPVPNVNAGPDRILCSYDTAQLFAAVLPSAFSPYTYQWHPGINLTDSLSPSPVFQGNASTGMEVIVKTPGGCTGKDSVYLTVHPGKFIEATADTGVCPPALVQLEAKGAMSYKWSPAYGLSDTGIANPIATPGTSVTYTAVGVNAYNCVDSAKVTVDVYSNAVINLPDEVTIWPGEHYTMNPQGNCLYFHWFPSSGLSDANASNPDAAPEVRTRYFVTATTEHGCIVKDSIDVLVNDESALDMPNAFAPGSSVNGELKVVRRGIATLKYFRIYNRWGNKVFESTNIDKGWDGTYNGKPQPVGVYIYSIEAVTKKGTPFTKQGNVTLIR